MEALAHDLEMEGAIRSEFFTVETNLFELIDAIHEELNPEEDWIATSIILDLIDTGKMRFLGARTDNH